MIAWGRNRGRGTRTLASAPPQDASTPAGSAADLAGATSAAQAAMRRFAAPGRRERDRSARLPQRQGPTERARERLARFQQEGSRAARAERLAQARSASAGEPQEAGLSPPVRSRSLRSG
jgi:hypothetical protein